MQPTFVYVENFLKNDVRLLGQKAKGTVSQQYPERPKCSCGHCPRVRAEEMQGKSKGRGLSICLSVCVTPTVVPLAVLSVLVERSVFVLQQLRRC